MRNTVTIGSLAGIRIEVHASWLLVYALITWTLAVGYFPAALGPRPAITYWVSGLVAALLLFVSVLLHELSHALAARAQGLQVRAITLHLFGGVSQLEGEPPTPRAEFLIAVVGPLTSFAIAAVIRLIQTSGALPAIATSIARYLVFVNAAVGVFNLLPGFPLDGGRLLRAVLWAWRGTLPSATYLASRAGVAVAFGLVVLGLLQILGGGVLGGVWMILIGFFLRTAADASYAQSTLEATLDRLRVRDVMSSPVITVPPDATLAAVAEAFWAHRFTSFPVVADDVVRGIATIDTIRDIPRDQWDATRVSAVMQPLSDDLVVTPDVGVVDALRKASRNRIGRLAVLQTTPGGRLVGYVSLKDITHVLALRGLPPHHGIAGPARRAA